jgi:hypothetical protein
MQQMQLRRAHSSGGLGTDRSTCFGEEWVGGRQGGEGARPSERKFRETVDLIPRDGSSGPPGRALPPCFICRTAEFHAEQSC